MLKELERPNSFQLNSNKPNTVVNAVNYVFTAFMANWYITSSQIKGGGENSFHSYSASRDSSTAGIRIEVFFSSYI